MRLSAAAQKTGWSALTQGPREKVKAVELEPYLRSEFYGGRSFWRLFEPLFWGALLLLILVLGIRDWIVNVARRNITMNDDQHWTRMLAMSSVNQPPRGSFEGPVIRSLRRLFSGLPNLSTRRAPGLPLGQSKSQFKEEASAIPNPVLRVGIESTSRITSQVEAAEASPKVVSEAGGLPSPPPSGSKPRKEAKARASDHLKLPKDRMIFPGKSRRTRADELPANWDESQWID